MSPDWSSREVDTVMSTKDRTLDVIDSIAQEAVGFQSIREGTQL